MKKHDLFAMLIVLLITLLLVTPLTGQAFFSFTSRYLILGGFIKFFIFASLGDLLSQRLTKKNYRVKGLFYKAIVWGFIGILVVYVFRIFTEGILYLQTVSLLPLEGNALAFAFFTSLFMNLIFAPTMMLMHRLSDDYIDGVVTNKSHRLNDSVNRLNYQSYMQFVLFKTIPFFWIPAHTITFLLNETYRVFFAALLGVALGLLLGLAKHISNKEAT